MIAYFDTSAIVPLLIDEAGTERSRSHWLGADRLFTVRIAHVEARAALAQAARGGRVASAQLRRAVSALPALFEQVEAIEVDDELVRRAGDLAETRALRANDAVHLAAALRVQDLDLVLVAGEALLLTAAASEGLATAVTS